MEPKFRIYNILRPLGWLFGAATAIRNRRFDRHPGLSISFPVPVISVGNISVGGTGKTPHTEYIVALVKERFCTAVLSRGYGRCTHGYILAQSASTSREIGDEPRQILRRFPDVCIAVCENRAEGIETLMRTRKPQVIVLDDAYQHRRVNPSLNILLVDYNRNILYDAMLPAGRLRESKAGRKRAHIIIVTKCPAQLTSAAMESLAAQLAVSPDQQVYFTTLEYGSLYALDGKQTVPASDAAVLAVTGIANPAPMETELRSRFKEVSMLSYPDHHDFTARDIREIEHRLDGMPAGSVIVTTAKDAARLESMDLSADLKQRIFVLPVKPAFLRDGSRFDSTILNHIETFEKP